VLFVESNLVSHVMPDGVFCLRKFKHKTPNGPVRFLGRLFQVVHAQTSTRLEAAAGITTALPRVDSRLSRGQYSPCMIEQESEGTADMPTDDLVFDYCRRDLETFRKRLRRLRSGRLKFGNSVDGISWNETTAQDIAFAEKKIAELEEMLKGLNG
jgi:hypothetical protein